MTQSDRERQSVEAKSEERALDAAAHDDEDDEDTPSPFDHPAFMPVLLWALALWFGYDGWFNEDIEAVNFNRYGFGVLVVAGIYYTVQAMREMRDGRSDS